MVLSLVALVSVPSAHAQSEKPLVIVFDTSSSMADNDNNGQNKLLAAQTLMSDLVRERGDNVDLGLWTYPGGASVEGCAAGSWVPDMEPLKKPDPTNVDAQIRLLTANGDTPTGPALQKVVAELKAQGYHAAHIVLVTDGLANCGIPACEAARGIINEGFEIEVAAVAFNMGSESTQDLECLAKVTGGSFTSTENSEDLLKEIEEYKDQDLQLDVTALESVRRGDMTSVTATITNPKDEPVTGAALAIDVLPVVGSTNDSNATTAPVSPSGVKHYSPVRYPLSTIEAHGTIRRTWRFLISGDTNPRYQWKVYAGVHGKGAVVKTGNMEITDHDLTRHDGGELLASHGGTVVVLGDSYSSGEGAGDYANTHPPSCHRSPNVYGQLIGGKNTKIIACSGATTRDVLGGASEKQVSQIDLLRKIENPDVVVLTMGGNDIGFSDIVKECFLHDCQSNERKYRDFVSHLAHMSGSYMELSEVINSKELIAKRGGKLAPLIVSPYPDPFWSPSRGKCNHFGLNGFTSSEIAMSKRLLATLNERIRTEVKEAQAQGYPVYFSEPVITMAAGHSICVEDSYFVRLTLSDAVRRSADDFKTRLSLEKSQWDKDYDATFPELFHPNREGHHRWAQTLIAWSKSEDLQLRQQAPRVRITAGDRIIQALTSNVAPGVVRIDVDRKDLQASVDAAELTQSTEKRAVAQGDAVDVHLEGMAPKTRVLIQVRSTPQTVGSLPVDDKGMVSGKLTLPRVTNGQHELVVVGWNEDYRFVGTRIPITVSAGLPLFVVIVAGFMLAAAAGGVFFVVRRKRILKKLQLDE
ncbi:VWA domain-containing protein [Schaalia sp. ZJ405]|uniref:GDSL-type esterase/lipase family protein n=1 Tax=Schaalia sp. ZJ405 TaxID=2709403 RepID=UPI0013E9C1DC|nr:GDSL-type esterase/lipase family protein [Schaalia sp. ZJ405]QPK80472.1 VWA domain-containing protein [Schaalia sp. ZJ405]